MKTAVVYARYSCDKQTEQSIEGQLRVCNEYAKANDILIVDKYIDQAMSGTNDNRPDFQRMLRDSKKKQWDYVLVYKLDRFSRDKYESVIHKRALRNNGVKVISAMELIPDTPEGLILESLLEGMNQYYSDELSQKVKRGMKETRIKGLFQGGRLLYGYKLDGRKVVINENEAEIVKMFFNKYNAGIYVPDIIDDLNKKNISNRGKRWLKSTVYNMLANEKYTGKYTCNGEIVNNIYPQIIGEDLFEVTKAKKLACQLGSTSKDTNYLLKGKLYCGYCGKLINADCSVKKNKTYRYYTCSGKKNFKNGCKKSILKKETIENFIINEVIKKLKNPKIMEPLIDNILKYQKNNDEKEVTLTLLQKEKNQSKRALDNLLSAMENGIVNKSTNDRILDLEKKLESLEQQISIEEQKTKETYTREYLIKYYDDMLLNNTNLVISYLIKKIRIFEEKIEITFNSPTNKSSDNQGFFFCEIFGIMAVNLPHTKNVKFVNMHIELFV